MLTLNCQAVLTIEVAKLSHDAGQYDWPLWRRRRHSRGGGNLAEALVPACAGMKWGAGVTWGADGVTSLRWHGRESARSRH
jgi:hypothetical protein